MSDWLWSSCTLELIWICPMRIHATCQFHWARFWAGLKCTSCFVMPRMLRGFTQPYTSLTSLVLWELGGWCVPTWLGHLVPAPRQSGSWRQWWGEALGAGTRGKGLCLWLLCESILMWDCGRLSLKANQDSPASNFKQNKATMIIYDSVSNRDSLFGNICIEEVEVIY